MKKPMRIMLLLLAILFANVLLYHFIKYYLTQKNLDKEAEEAVTVSAISVKYDDWQPEINSIAELIAEDDVDIMTEVEGIIEKIYISSGQFVKKGDVLFELKADEDVAALRALEAEAALARITYERDKEQYAINVISKETLDMDKYNMDMQQALVEQQAALVAKKVLRAPFDGKLGMFYYSVGQYFNPGDLVVTLQKTDSIYVYFYTPEKNVKHLEVGQEVILTSDVYPHETFKGTISAINVEVDEGTHNIQLEAIVPNPDRKLIPGMFANVKIKIGEPKKYLTIPQTAVSFNPFGNLVYVIKEKKSKEHDKKTKLMAKQRFVTLGQTRGDQIAVLAGLEEGDLIVTSGQVKLKNNAKVHINNENPPKNNANPQVSNQS